MEQKCCYNNFIIEECIIIEENAMICYVIIIIIAYRYQANYLKLVGKYARPARQLSNENVDHTYEGHGTGIISQHGSSTSYLAIRCLVDIEENGAFTTLSYGAGNRGLERTAAEFQP